MSEAWPHPTIDTFLEARVTEDSTLPPDDVQLKRRVIEIHRALDTDAVGELSKDAWVVVGEILRLLCLRYRDHPDYNPAWAPQCF